jgi:hypothetical protein
MRTDVRFLQKCGGVGASAAATCFVLASLVVNNQAWADDRDLCTGASGDIAIVACNHVIDSKQLKGADLSKVYVSRGKAFVSKGATDDALNDFGYSRYVQVRQCLAEDARQSSLTS